MAESAYIVLYEVCISLKQCSTRVRTPSETDLFAGGGVVYLRVEKKSPRLPGQLSLTGAAVVFSICVRMSSSKAQCLGLSPCAGQVFFIYHQCHRHVCTCICMGPPGPRAFIEITYAVLYVSYSYVSYRIACILHCWYIPIRTNVLVIE
jgi:hypothetical protein